MFELTEYIGIIAFAISGFLVGVRNKLDLLGVFISVFLTAFGGGLIRDVIAHRNPYTFMHAAPAVLVVIVLLLMIYIKLHKKQDIENRVLFILSDSIGLVSFSISGALIALEIGFNLTGIMAISFITAVGGGITRDIIINEVPFVFKSGFYGSIALLIGFTIFTLSLLNFVNYFTLTLIFFGGVFLRLIAYYKKWSLPTI